jgi:hypothetical protein
MCFLYWGNLQLQNFIAIISFFSTRSPVFFFQQIKYRAKSGLKAASGLALNLGGATLGRLISSDQYNVFPIDKVLRGGEQRH